MNLGFRERRWPGDFVRAKRPDSRPIRSSEQDLLDQL